MNIDNILEIIAGALACIASFAWCCKKKDSQVEIADAEPETQVVNYYVYQNGRPWPRNYQANCDQIFLVMVEYTFGFGGTGAGWVGWVGLGAGVAG